MQSRFHVPRMPTRAAYGEGWVAQPRGRLDSGRSPTRLLRQQSVDERFQPEGDLRAQRADPRGGHRDLHIAQRTDVPRGGLDVAMDETDGVRGGQRVGDLGAVLHDLPEG
nr:hypothetical protein [Streptomyces spongiae]